MILLLALSPPIEKTSFPGGSENELVAFVARTLRRSTVMIASERKVPEGFYFWTEPDADPLDKKSAIRLTENSLAIWWDVRYPNAVRPKIPDDATLLWQPAAPAGVPRPTSALRPWTSSSKEEPWTTEKEEAATLAEIADRVRPLNFTYQWPFERYRFRLAWAKNDGAKDLLEAVANAVGAKLVPNGENGLRMVVDPLPHRAFLAKLWESRRTSQDERTRLDAEYMTWILRRVRPATIEKAYGVPESARRFETYGELLKPGTRSYRAAYARYLYYRGRVPGLAEATAGDKAPRMIFVLDPGGLPLTNLSADKDASVGFEF